MVFITLFCVYLGLIGGLCQEPHCSKFSYDEQLLEKLVRMEFSMEKMKEHFDEMAESLKNETLEIKENYKDVVDALEKETSRADMTSEMVKVLTAEKDNYLKEMDKLKTELDVNLQHKFYQKDNAMKGKEEVAFSARNPENLDVKEGETLVFTTTTINVGNGYNRSTGHFTAPRAGLYLFHDQICLEKDKDFYLQIFASGRPVLNSRYAANSVYAECFAASVTLSLRKGDNVYLQCRHTKTPDFVLAEDTNRWNMFSGILLG